MEPGSLSCRETLENYLDVRDASKKRCEAQKEESAEEVLQQILSELPEEWTQKIETENHNSWTDMYDNYHPAYNVSITQYSGRSSDLEFVISGRLPRPREGGCSVSNTYELKIVEKGKETFTLKHLTNYDWNTECSILAKQLFDLVEKKYCATQEQRE